MKTTKNKKALSISARLILISFFSSLILTGCSEDKKPAETMEKQTESAIPSQTEQLADETVEAGQEQKQTIVAAVTDKAAAMQQVEERTNESPTTEPTTVEPPTTKSQDDSSSEELAREAKTHIVKAVVTKFQPMVLFVNLGDTVTWTNMTGHDTAAVEGMIPEGVEAWHSKMGDQFSLKFTETGAYVYKCTPHVSLGMLGAIIVGEGQPSNLDQIVGNPENKGMVGRAVREMKKALDER
jgi:pseudoazurin